MSEQSDPEKPHPASVMTSAAQQFEKGSDAAQGQAKAMESYRLAADQGCVMAQTILGWRYTFGHDVDRDDVKALHWFRRAADQGYSTAQYGLAFMYRFGRGVDKDDSEAVRLYRLAAENGNRQARDTLGYLYATGECVTKDEVEALRHYRIAAEQVQRHAQFEVGHAIEFEVMGSDEDAAAAARVYRQSAEQGHTDALHGLATLYQEGRGGERNRVEALKWLNVAIYEGCEEAREWREEIESTLTQEEIARARELARKYVDSVDGDRTHPGQSPTSLSE